FSYPEKEISRRTRLRRRTSAVARPPGPRPPWQIRRHDAWTTMRPLPGAPIGRIRKASATRRRSAAGPRRAVCLLCSQAFGKGKEMKPRLQFFDVAPELMKQVRMLNRAVEESGLERCLLHLVKLRASQINGCSFCVDMHSKEALQDGDTLQ